MLYFVHSKIIYTTFMYTHGHIIIIFPSLRSLTSKDFPTVHSFISQFGCVRGTLRNIFSLISLTLFLLLFLTLSLIAFAQFSLSFYLRSFRYICFHSEFLSVYFAISAALGAVQWAIE